MGGKQSTSTTATTSSSPINAIPPSSNPLLRYQAHQQAGQRASASSSTAQYQAHRSSLNPHQLLGGGNDSSRQRARSLSHVPIIPNNNVLTGVNYGASSTLVGASLGGGGDSDGSSTTPDDSAGNSLENALFGGRVYAAHSLPTQLSSAFNGIKCPVCCKFVIPDDLEYHLVMCLTKPRISYNEDILSEDKGECVICLEDLQQGDTIARLPCLCIYHKYCIDSWFEVNRSCPEHPSD